MNITKLGILSLVLISSITWATIPEGSATGEDSVAIGNHSKAEGWFSTAIGYESKANGYSSISIGDFAEAGTAVPNDPTGWENNSIAIGSYAKALKENAIALGASAAAGKNAIAIGEDAQAVNKHSISLGFGSISKGDTSISIGDYSLTESKSSVALGENARTIHNKSVALGYGAVSLEENTISVAYKDPNIAIDNQPEEPFYRKIVGLADGVNNHDAVNVSQLKGLESSLISKINAFSMTEVKANAGISSAMAMAALPQPTGKGISLGASVGMYMGQPSYALGVSGTEGNVRYNINTSLTSKANVGFSAGIGYTFKAKEEVKETNEVEKLKTKIKISEEKINTLTETIKELLNRIEKLEKK